MQQLFASKKALALSVPDHGPADLPQEVAHAFVALPGFFQQKVKVGRQRLFSGKNRLKVRVQLEFKGGGAHDEVQQTVNGADVQRAHVAHDGVNPASGRGRVKVEPLHGAAQRRAFQLPDHALAHLGGSGIGKGDSQNVAPAAGAAIHKGAGGGGRSARSAAADEALQKAARQFIGFSRSGGCFDLS